MRTSQQEFFLRQLEGRLTGYYQPPQTPGGHDVLHVRSVVRLGSVLRQYLSFDEFEYEVAAWLHNLDRPHSLKILIDRYRQRGEDGLASVAADFLEGAPFDVDQRQRIITVVKDHPKFLDDLANDSPLLTAIRIADKVVRLGPDGIVSAAAVRGQNLLMYDSACPFGYDSTAESKLKTVYNDFFRILEWYALLPFDWARALIAKADMECFLGFVRHFGRMIAERCGTVNGVEIDIEKALGPYYHQFA